MSKHKTRESLTRAAAADRLRALADQIAQGRASTGALEVAVPEQVTFKLEVEDDEVEVQLRW